MLVERITLESDRVQTERELAPEITLRATPAYPECNDTDNLQLQLGDGNSITLPAPDSDTV
jgi:hypothetical protein